MAKHIPAHHCLNPARNARLVSLGGAGAKIVCTHLQITKLFAPFSLGPVIWQKPERLAVQLLAYEVHVTETSRPTASHALTVHKSTARDPLKYLCNLIH